MCLDYACFNSNNISVAGFTDKKQVPVLISIAFCYMS